MGVKRTIIALLLLGGLGAYVYFVEVKGGKKKEEAEKEAKRVVTIRQEDIERLVIDNEHGHIELMKQAGKWRMAAPVSAPSDESTVNGLLASLTSAETKSTIDDVKDFTPFGLTIPQATIEIYGVGGRHEKLRIGKRSAVSQDLYVRRGDESKVLQTTGGLDGTPTREPDAFREKRLFSFEGDAVTAVTISMPERTVVLRRQGDDWRMLKPLLLDADDATVRQIAQDIAGLRASKWLVENATPNDLKTYELTSPTTLVEVQLLDGSKHAIRFGPNRQDQRVAKVDGQPQIVYVADWSYKQLTKTPEELRDRRLFPVQPGDVARLVLRQGEDKVIALKRESVGWSIAGNASGQANPSKVDELLTALADLRATEWKPATPQSRKDHELDPPLRVVEAYNQSGELIGVVKFGKEEDGWSVWAQGKDPLVEAKTPNDFVKNKWPYNPTDLFAAPATK